MEVLWWKSCTSPTDSTAKHFLQTGQSGEKHKRCLRKEYNKLMFQIYYIHEISFPNFPGFLLFLWNVYPHLYILLSQTKEKQRLQSAFSIFLQQITVKLLSQGQVAWNTSNAIVLIHECSSKYPQHSLTSPHHTLIQTQALQLFIRSYLCFHLNSIATT